MSSGPNTFGDLFRWTTFGESHGSAMGVVIDGCPAGILYDEALLLQNLASRRPGAHATTSARHEADHPEILSGIFENTTLGTPIAVIVRNTDVQSKDYDAIRDQARVGHADDLWTGKFGLRDHRGGGRASARETLNWVVAGSFAQMFLKKENPDMAVTASLIEVGGEPVSSIDHPEFLQKMKTAKDEGESFGGIVEVKVSQPAKCLGEPIFKKTKSQLAHAFMTINACVGVELGGGFSLAQQKGTETHTESDNPAYGGIRGGMTTGEDIIFRLAFKPTSSIKDVAKQGRHDPCVAIRAVPIATAMAWNVLADLTLAKQLNR